MTSDLSARRRHYRTALTVMVLLDLAALVYLLSPLGGSRAQLQDGRDRMQQQLQVRKREAAPLKDLDKKLLLARRETSDFYDHRIASEYSAIPEQLGKLAQADNVHISAAKYGTEDAEVPGLRRVVIEAGVDGDYLHVVRFINALERDRMFFIVDSVALSEQQGGTVKLQMKLETYLKA